MILATRARRRVTAAALTLIAGLAVTACGSSGSTAPSDTSSAGSSAAASGSGAATTSAGSSPSSATSAAASSATGSAAAGGGAAGDCAPASLQTVTPDTLTIATSEPAFEPWMVDNDPSNGQGFESAVAYAVAEQLGYTEAQVTWVRVAFDEAIVRQEGWDFDINQFTITPERAEVVDFSPGYYDVTQVVVTVAGSPISGATTVAALKDAQLGAQNGTTSLQAIEQVVQPTQQPSVFDDNALAVQALQNGQIDGLVLDLPTAFFVANAQLTDGQIVGQLPAAGSAVEQLGLLLRKDSPLTPCVSEAVTVLREDGTLEQLEAQWLTEAGNAPELT